MILAQIFQTESECTVRSKTDSKFRAISVNHKGHRPVAVWGIFLHYCVGMKSHVLASVSAREAGRKDTIVITLILFAVLTKNE